jgi:S1-C subfamily serine protease
MRLIAATVAFALLPLATAAWAGGPDEGPDGATLLQAAKSIVQVISSGCGDEDRAGSAFALGKDGLFVTDLHVVAGCTDYQLKYQPLGDSLGTEYQATLVHVLEARDLALLKVSPPPDIPGLELASTAAQVSEKLQVIGYPLGLGKFTNQPLNVTLAAAEKNPELQFTLDDPSRKELKAKGYPALDTDVLQVDGNLEPGDSGAPLIDWQGKVAAIGDGGLQRGTVGLGWATQPVYVGQLLTSNEALKTVASLGVASVDFAETVPKTRAEEADSKVQCGALTLVQSRDVRAGELIRTTDDPIKLRKLVKTLIGVPVEQFADDKFTIWTEPKSGAGIALPKGLRIEAGTDGCTVHTDASNIDYLIALAPLSSDPTTAEWEIEANRDHWLAYYRATVAVNMYQIDLDRKDSVARRFENGGVIVRQMATGTSKDREPFRIFTNDLSGRGAFVSVAVINREAKPDPGQMAPAERNAWAQGLLAVNLTALPPRPEASLTPPPNGSTAERTPASAFEAASAPASDTGAAETSDMVWPGERNFRRVRCGDARLIPLSQPRTLADLAGAADLDAVLEPVAGVSRSAITKDLFDVWVQPLKGAIVPLPHGVTLTPDQQVCRIASPSASIGFALRIVSAGTQREAAAATQAFVRDLVQAASARFHPDPAAQIRESVEPHDLVRGRLMIGTGPRGRRALIYYVSLRRDQILTLFAMTDTDVKAAEALAPADRAALAQGLAAVRLSTLLPPTGFLDVAQK